LSIHNYYSVLGLKETCSNAEIKAAYRELIRQVHPDSIPDAPPYWKGKAEQKAQELNEAYRVLSDRVQREEFDKRLAEHRRAARPQYDGPSTGPETAYHPFTQQTNSQQRPAGAAFSSGGSSAAMGGSRDLKKRSDSEKIGLLCGLLSRKVFMAFRNIFEP
jgi:curved DNA-binding protein CbpA